MKFQSSRPDRRPAHRAIFSPKDMLRLLPSCPAHSTDVPCILNFPASGGNAHVLPSDARQARSRRPHAGSYYPHSKAFRRLRRRPGAAHTSEALPSS